jgi:hypothetical protein
LKKCQYSSYAPTKGPNAFLETTARLQAIIGHYRKKPNPLKKVFHRQHEAKENPRFLTSLTA